MTESSHRGYRDHSALHAAYEAWALALLERFALRDMAAARIGDERALMHRTRSPEGVRTVVAALRQGPPDVDSQGPVAQLGRMIAGRVAATEPTPPIHDMAARLGLDALERELLALLWVLQTSPEIHALAQALWPGQSVDGYATGFLVSTLAERPSDRRRILERLDAHAPLMRWDLVVHGTSRPGPWPVVALRKNVLAFLDGRPIRPKGRLFRPPEPGPTVAPHRLASASDRSRIESVLLSGEPRPHALFIAPDSALPLELLHGYAAQMNRPLLMLEVRPPVPRSADAAPPSHDAEIRWRRQMDQTFRDAAVSGAWLVLKVPMGLPVAAKDAIDLLARRVETLPTAVIVLAEQRSPSVTRLARGAPTLTMGGLDLDALTLLWGAASPNGVSPDPGMLQDVLQNYRLTPAAVVAASPDALARAALAGSDIPNAHNLASAARAQMAAGFEGLASRVDAHFDWEDLILPPDTLDSIREVVASVSCRDQVMERWGFGSKFPYGAGTTVLFSGPPGTGKTMTAGIIAAELGRDLYRVDLSQIFDRYIGETEKNLGRIFDGAESGDIIILFDEADSLFSQRTEVKSSNDRYANLEVNYLLQRLESYTGMAILTTNMDSSLDPAFRRRIRYSVRFPEPDFDTRERLWSSMIPGQAALADDVDFGELADVFEISGGSIKNAVLRAAYLAASEGDEIGRAHLVRAGLAECAALGKLARYVPELDS